MNRKQYWLLLIVVAFTGALGGAVSNCLLSTHSILAEAQASGQSVSTNPKVLRGSRLEIVDGRGRICATLAPKNDLDGGARLDLYGNSDRQLGAVIRLSNRGTLPGADNKASISLSLEKGKPTLSLVDQTGKLRVIRVSKDNMDIAKPPELKNRGQNNKQETTDKGELPSHKIAKSRRPGRTRNQIRAIIPKGTYTEEEINGIAIRLVDQYKVAPSLVQFFDDESCLQGWNGTGLLRDSDWPHWLGRAPVDMDRQGQLSARFKLAVDENTGSPRTDVLRQK